MNDDQNAGEGEEEDAGDAVIFDEETSTHPKDKVIPASYGAPGGLQE